MNEMARNAWICLLLVAAALAGGCEMQPKPYGVEHQLFLPGSKRQVWAIAPVLNLSGQRAVDALLQADLLYQQLQQVHGLTVVPVNRVVEAYAGLKIEKVQSPDQAASVCKVLGCDALVVATVTIYDPYDPPKFGASLQVFPRESGESPARKVDLRQLSRAAAIEEDDEPSLPKPDESHFSQAVGIYDASNGSVRESVLEYARGRTDPLGPMGVKEYFQSMDRYCGFAYSALTVDLLKQLEKQRKQRPQHDAEPAR